MTLLATTGSYINPKTLTAHLPKNGKLEEVPQQEVPEQPKPAPPHPKVVKRTVPGGY
jgi:hypothetical protein